MIDFNKISLAVFDIDGVLTDGKYSISSPDYTSKGDTIVIKSFYTRDFYAIEKLLENNIRVAILSQCSDKVIFSQRNRLCSGHLTWKKYFNENKIIIETGLDDKKAYINSILLNNSLNYTWDNIAYIGDAENDLECMKYAGFTGCPSDAIDIVKENSTYISDFKGGDGCVYDFIMYILKQREKKQ